ncbi:YfcC family protein [Shimazuella kribbensis]|uniref:YfcC family protein n=1 Tax=Shimazuella kribbensis TaxID=139808 RepID=UPI00041758A6|nr:Na+/H+ antiporter NhaC family protein [Shimazuella kribbensis]
MQSATIKKEKSSRLKKRPDAYVLLFIVLVICAVATYLVPAGEYDRKELGDREITVPGTYHAVEANHIDFVDFFVAIQEGMVKGAPIIFLVLFTGGALHVIEKTGALNVGISRLVHKLRNHETLLIVIICFVFSILGTTAVIVNSVIAFIPLGIMLARAMKLDAIVGVALIYLGTYAGFNAPVTSPVTLGLSQEIADLPLFSGIEFRIIIYLAVVAVTIIYICMYVKKLRKDPSKSILGANAFPGALGSSEEKLDQNAPFTARHKFIIAFTTVVLTAFIACTFYLEWDTKEMTATFIFMAIGVGLIAKMSANEIAKTFLQGCQKLVYGALIVGMARAVVVILEDGKLLDTIVYGLATVLEPLSSVAAAIGMFIGSGLIHFLISSGSGESVVLMPIFAPLADVIGITRQVAVQALMFGEGFVNCINPTSGVLMAVLATSGISYGKWLRFMLPLTAIWVVLGMIFLAIGVMINWGPF